MLYNISFLWSMVRNKYDTTDNQKVTNSFFVKTLLIKCFYSWKWLFWYLFWLLLTIFFLKVFFKWKIVKFESRPKPEMSDFPDFQFCVISHFIHPVSILSCFEIKCLLDVLVCIEVSFLHIFIGNTISR